MGSSDGGATSTRADSAAGTGAGSAGTAPCLTVPILRGGQGYTGVVGFQGHPPPAPNQHPLVVLDDEVADFLCDDGSQLGVEHECQVDTS